MKFQSSNYSSQLSTFFFGNWACKFAYLLSVWAKGNSWTMHLKLWPLIWIQVLKNLYSDQHSINLISFQLTKFDWQALLVNWLDWKTRYLTKKHRCIPQFAMQLLGQRFTILSAHSMHFKQDKIYPPRIYWSERSARNQQSNLGRPLIYTTKIWVY